MDLDLGLLKTLVATHCPVLHLYPGDQFSPSTAEYFLKHSALWAAGSGTQGSAQGGPLAAQGALDGWQLLAAQRRPENAGRTLFLQLDPTARPGMPLHMLNSVPLYVVAKVVDVEAVTAAPTVLELSYLTLYPYNGPYTAGRGAHDGDWEHLTVRVALPGGALLGVWYNSHRSRDGEWVPASRVPRREADGRILAYVARHGHGTYPRASACTGCTYRLFGLGNDLTSEEGPVWDPTHVVLLPYCRGAEPEGPPAEDSSQQGAPPPPTVWRLEVCPSRGSTLSDPGPPPSAATQPAGRPAVVTDHPCPWLWFRGQWGQTDAPATQSWFGSAECPVSRSPFHRLFLQLAAETRSI